MKQISGKDFAKLLSQKGWELKKIHGSHHVFHQTRDLLLPKLISGELNVSELDIETGEQANETPVVSKEKG